MNASNDTKNISRNSRSNRSFTCRAAIDSVRGGADVLIIDNGADEEVKVMLDGYAEYDRIHVETNPKNIYVNPAWNQIMEYFLGREDYTHLVIMNSDLTMCYLWDLICKYRWDKYEDEILVPVINPDKDIFPAPYVLPAEIVTNGTPGVFIAMNRKQVEVVCPIPENIKIWFGDNWIYSVLRGMGYKTVIPPNLTCTTQWSQTIKKIPEAASIIEQDKIEWEKCKPELLARIDKYAKGNCYRENQYG